MAVDMDQVRAALDPEEPNYPAAAKLGPDALPHLERLITGDHPGLAAKAAYLAGLIGTEKSLPAMDKAARSGQTAVRIAAAAGAQHLAGDHAEAVLLQLVDDSDPGVRKVAARSAPAGMSDALRARVAAHSAAAPKPAAAKKPAKKSAAKKAAAKKPAAAAKPSKPAKAAKPKAAKASKAGRSAKKTGSRRKPR